MRIRYSYSAEMDEIDDRIRMHLEDFKNNKSSIDCLLSEIIEEFKKKKANHSKVLERIEDLRLLMGELDILLEESAGIVSVCSEQKTEPVVSSEQPVSSVGKQTEEKQSRVNPLEGVQGSLKQISDMAKTLNEMRTK